jgi:hypothetical protein
MTFTRFLFVLAAWSGFAFAANAETIGLSQSTADAWGNFSGACWAISDGGFAKTPSDATLTTTLNLESVSLNHRLDGDSGTPTALYLQVYTGNSGSSGTFVGCSTNTVGFASLAENAVGTWTFDHLTLNATSVYSYMVSTTSTAYSGSAVRVMIGSGGPLTTGALLDSNNAVVCPDYDACVAVSVAPVPEPAALALLGACLPFLVTYAWRKRKCLPS